MMMEKFVEEEKAQVALLNFAEKYTDRISGELNKEIDTWAKDML